MMIEAFGTPFIFIVFRYKSILCREDAYLLERVRYIHLNPIRTKWVSDIKVMDKHAFSGHCAIMGKVKRHWQDYEWVLGLFNDRLGVARRRYKAFVAKGYDLDKLASRVCELMHLEPSELWAPGKERKRVAARSLLCYWAARDLGIGLAQIARRLNLSLAGVSQSVKRGEAIVQQKSYNLVDL